MNGMNDASRPQFNRGDVHVQEVIHSAQSELRLLLQQRAELMKRIGSIKQTINGLANIFGDSMLNDELLALLDRKTARQSGFTRACRAVLMEAAGPLNVREVCDLLRKKSPGLLERHKEPGASVATVLGRLVAYGEAHSFVNEDGRRVWQWTAYAGDGKLISAFQSPLGRARSEA
jgi:hypothetical protein